MQTLSANIPALSPLSTCLLVESKFSSRRSMMRKLSRKGLFKQLVEGQSVMHGLSLLANQAFNACIIGPSVTTKKAVTLLQKAKRIPTNSRCAFIAVVKSGTREEKQLCSVGCHATLDNEDVSAEAIAIAVIQAVAKADTQGSWARAIRDGATSRESIEETLVAAALRATIKGLEEIQRGLKSGEYGLDRFGHVSLATENHIRMMVTNALRRYESSPRFSEFKEFYIEVLKDWVVDFVQVSPQHAKHSFTERMLRYDARQ